MAKEKNYCGSGRQANEYYINISVCLSDIPASKIREWQGKRYIDLTVGKRKKEGENGKTHWVAINDFVPDKKSDENEDFPW